MHGTAGLACGAGQAGAAPGEVRRRPSGEHLQEYGAHVTDLDPVQGGGHRQHRGSRRRRGHLGIDDRGPADSEYLVPGTPSRAGITAQRTQGSRVNAERPGRLRDG